ncbi:MAG: hypothetical protein ACXWUG_30250 [Polyangiales bacterium]
MSRPFGWAHALCCLPLVVAVAPALAAKKKPPPPKPKPVPTAPTGTTATTSEPEPPKKEPPKAKPRVEIGACPPESLSEMEGTALVTFLRKRCRNLKVPEDAAPTEIGDDESLVAICVQPGAQGEETEAVEPKTCELKATVEIEGQAPHPLVPDGDLALVLRTARLTRSLHHGSAFALVASSAGETEAKTIRSPLVFKKAVEGYGPIWVWMPMPMFTTDFSSSPQGYRFGITPLAVAVGGKLHPGSSRAYFGLSAFLAWNLLVPNDTQTLSNGTGVRINYKAIGTGVLFDGSGWVGLGLGIGHTFTTDARTDFRSWFYLGPRLLFGLNEW